MHKRSYKIGGSKVDYYFAGGLSQLRSLTDPSRTVLITDEHVFQFHEKRFKGWNCIILKAGEAYKTQETVNSIIEQLIAMEADRSFTLVGIGGGVVTDLTGYVASIYMRGIRFGFVPTTLLALVDASIGGKNGIDVGVYKNLVGIIRQPDFLLHDLIFLNTLPDSQWINGFAEIIKHAAIKDAALFRELEGNSLAYYRKKKAEACRLIERNVLLKTRVVLGDPTEQGDRKLLNFGHTLGHALENQYELAHGEAISIGMTYASRLSSVITGFRQADRVRSLLGRYQLPTEANYDKDKVISVLKMDKKKSKDKIQFVLLERLGKAVYQPIAIDQLYETL